MIGFGYKNIQQHPDETLIWSPEGNLSFQALEWKNEIFGASANMRSLEILITAKEPIQENRPY